jgi:hypothetical protein
LPAHEVNKQLEEEKKKNTYFLVSEIEADFFFFEKQIIPQLEESVMVQIGKYIRNGYEDDLGKLFFQEIEVEDEQYQNEGGDLEPSQIPPKGEA